MSQRKSWKSAANKRLVQHLPDLVFWFLLIIFSYLFFINAWVIDEGYVTFRTIENFVQGHGLNWNLQERVQAYTHPLWLFVICLTYLFTSEFFFTSIGVSYIFCLTIFITTYIYAKKRLLLSPWLPSLIVLTLMASKAFIDYTSSGLENPLSYFLVMLFYGKFLIVGKRFKDYNGSEIFFMVLIASLAYFNRQDTFLLFIFPLVGLLIVGARRFRFRLLKIIILATSPAWMWTVFSIVYYGFPYPNTAYAKLINSGVPLGPRSLRGLEYLLNSVSIDSIIYLMLIVAAVWSIRRKNWRVIVSLSSVLIYFIYIVIDAASATHMSGRFFSVPFVIIALCFVMYIEQTRLTAIVAAILVVYMLAHPMSAIKMGSDWYYVSKLNPSCADTKYLVHSEGAGFMANLGKDVVPAHPWYFDGLLFRDLTERVHIGGPKESAAVGYFAFAAGPDKYIIDLVGLGDPLLARLQPANTAYYLPDDWHSGHFYRMEPIGYRESVRDGNNQLEEPGLNEYYDHLLTIIRGPIFSWERFKVIYHMNMGHYDHLLDYYNDNIKKARRVGIL